jgi:hypothetical protein
VRTRAPRQSRLGRVWRRLTADEQDLQSEQLQTEVDAEADATRVAQCPDRGVVCLTGTLRAVTMRPRQGAPALEADLYDGSGSVTLVWLGRRTIAGVEPGRLILVRGRVRRGEDGGMVMFNPDYELRTTQSVDTG